MHEKDLRKLVAARKCDRIELQRLVKPQGRARWAVLVNGEVLRSAALPIRPFATLDTAVKTIVDLVGIDHKVIVHTTPGIVEPDTQKYSRI